MPAPDGWVQTTRGPRPPAVRWPQAPSRGQDKPQHSNKKEADKGSTQPRPEQHSPPPLQQPSRSPESVAAHATADVSRLEIAISVLGEDNSHARPLLEALKVAKMQATVLPIQDRINACKAYLERARKRVARADAVIARALEQKSIFDGEVADGEKRLQELQLEEAQHPVLAPLPKVAELQQQIDDLVRERELLRAFQSRIPREHPGQWCANGPPGVKEVPPIPQDYANCDLRNALEFGNTGTITQFGTLLSQGIAQLSRVSKDVVMDRAVKVNVDGVDVRRVGRQAKVGARWRSSSCALLDVREPSVRIPSVWSVAVDAGASQAV